MNERMQEKMSARDLCLLTNIEQDAFFGKTSNLETFVYLWLYCYNF